MAGARKVDFNEVAHRPDYEVETHIRREEHAEERASRLRQREEDAKHARRKDLIVLVAILVGVAAVMGLCGWTAVMGASPDDKKWATAVLTSMVTAGLGYLSGKGQAKATE